jgi:hypothetical protein
MHVLTVQIIVMIMLQLQRMHLHVVVQVHVMGQHQLHVQYNHVQVEHQDVMQAHACNVSMTRSVKMEIYVQ